MKKLLSLLISLSIVFCLCAPFSAYGQSIEEKNPFIYAGEKIKPLKSSGSVYMGNSVSATYKNKTYYTKGKGLYQSVKSKLENRKTSFNIYCLSKDSLDMYSAMNNIVHFCYLGATDDEISTSSTDGDYLRWAVSSMKTSGVEKMTKKNGYNYYVIYVDFTYYDTAAQEKQVDNAIYSYVSSLNTNKMSDYQIVKHIHDYICNKNRYSYVAADSPENYDYAFCAYGAIIKGASVCQGYAAAFYRICKELGFKVRFVSSDPDRGCHAWNIVMLDGKYYTVDCTWDDQAMDEGKSASEQYYYFLTTYENALKRDSYYNEHELFSSIYSTQYFENNYKNYFAENTYLNEKGSRLSSCTVSLSANRFNFNGGAFTPSVKVYDNGVELEENVDYSVSYSSNVNPGVARVTVKGFGSYAGTSSQRLFRIIPSGASGLKKTAVSQNSVKLSWNVMPGNVSGYEVQYYVDDKWHTACVSSANSCEVTSLSTAKKYYFRVRPYKSVFRHNEYGAFCKSIAVSTTPAKGKIKALKAGKKSFKVSFKKLKGSGYQLQYSTKKNMKNNKQIKLSSKKKDKTVKKLKRGKKYYVRIRAYKKYKNENGKTVYSYGKWSAKKAVKIK